MTQPMTGATGLFVLLAAACASAQVTLSTVQGGAASPTGQIYNFGSVALGSVADAEFELTNTGSSPVYLTDLALAGTTSQTPPYAPNFAVVCALSADLCGAAPTQQLQILINPTGTLDFTVQFEPFQLGSPSAVMTVAAGNTITVFLSGTGVPGLTVLFDNQPLASGQTISFGSVQAGSSQTIALMLANQTNALLAVPAIPPLTGGGFSVAGSALSATSVPPGSSTELDVIFTPAAPGLQKATLTIGLNRYTLQGTGLAAPPAVCPVPSINLNLPTHASAQQGTLSVSLLPPAATSCPPGTVTLTFQSAVEGVSSDPTVTFADGTNSATFSVAQGAFYGQFGAEQTVSFGTGTTAGTLVFKVMLGSNPPQTTNVTIPAAFVFISAAVAERNVACDPALVYCTATNVQLQINGWDNTRGASQLVFNFFEASGAAIQPSPITFDATTDFQNYFTGATDQAGVFALYALFPVTGNSPDLVTEAQVQIVNSVGTAPATTITF